MFRVYLLDGQQNVLALAKPFAQLLAFHGEVLGAQAFLGRVALDHYAVGFLEALSQCVSCC